MNLLYPRIPLRQWGAMLLLALGGALVAGMYGILHDQITYSIGPEYFTKFKFQQFHYADFGFALRVYVAEIGFLATWWVGFFAAWFMARIAVPVWPWREAARRVGWGTVFICAAALIAGAIGYAWGLRPGVENGDLAVYAWCIGVQDARAFARVGYIHNAGYLGGLAGLLFALVRLAFAARARRRDRHLPTSGNQRNQFTRLLDS